MMQNILMVIMGLVGFFFFLWGLEVRINMKETNLWDAVLSLVFMIFGLANLILGVVYLVVH